MAVAEPLTGGNGQHVQANGLSVYYEEYGSGTPLILIHGGFGTGIEQWEPYIPEFAEHFRLIMPDSRGHGRTANPTGEFSYRLMADDVVALAQALNLDHPLVLGYSDGGQIALELGMHYPDLPRALGVGAAWFKFSDAYRETMKSFLSLDEEGNADPDRMERENPGLAGWLQQAQQAQGPDYWKTLVKQIVPTWMTPLNYTPEDFARIQAPTLVYTGDRDQVVPVEEAAEMYRMLPNAELYVVPNQGHGGTLGAPARSALLDFLLRHSAPADD
jgi:pimeloyl-ACP methyl ester carboxylesterase